MSSPEAVREIIAEKAAKLPEPVPPTAEEVRLSRQILQQALQRPMEAEGPLEEPGDAGQVEARQEGGDDEAEDEPVGQMENAARMLKQASDEGYQAFTKKDHMEAAKAWSKALMASKYLRDQFGHRHRKQRSELEVSQEVDLDDDPVDTALEQDAKLDMTELDQLELKLHLNMSMVTLKLREYREAARHARNALEYDPRNTKALFRWASGLMGLRRFDEAIKVLERSQLIDPESALTKSLLAEARHKEAAASNRLKRIKEKMMKFSFMTEHDDRLAPSWLQEWVAFFAEDIPADIRWVVTEARANKWKTVRYFFYATWVFWLFGLTWLTSRPP